MVDSYSTPHRWVKGEAITAEKLDAGNRAITEIINQNRILLDRLDAIERQLSEQMPVSGFMFVRITSQTVDTFDDAANDVKRWRYGVSEVYKTGKEGYDYQPTSGDEDAHVWRAKRNGFVGNAYNTIENMNTGLGIQGHGVDVDGANYPDGFNVMPAPIGCIVPAWIITVSPDPTQHLRDDRDTTVSCEHKIPFNEAWFSYNNPDDGTC